MVGRLWLRSPLAAQVLVGFFVLVPFLLAVPYAIHSHPPDPFSGLSGLGGSIGALIGARLRNPEYWQLDKGSRRRVRQVQQTGQPSGDRQIDTIAAGRLSMNSKSEKANSVICCVALVIMIATPLVAALRTGDSWWLLASLPEVLCLAFWLRAGRRESQQARLDRLVDQMGGIPSAGG